MRCRGIVELCVEAEKKNKMNRFEHEQTESKDGKYQEMKISRRSSSPLSSS